MNNEACTNNLCESWNQGFQQLIDQDHPSVWKFVLAIQKDNAEAHDNLLRNEHGEPPQKRVKRSTKQLQEKLFALCNAYRNGEKSIEDLLRAVGHSIKFKSKYF